MTTRRRPSLGLVLITGACRRRHARARAQSHGERWGGVSARAVRCRYGAFRRYGLACACTEACACSKRCGRLFASRLCLARGARRAWCRVESHCAAARYDWACARPTGHALVADRGRRTRAASKAHAQLGVACTLRGSAGRGGHVGRRAWRV
eukprot:202897-Prymnesium_polylepis.1